MRNERLWTLPGELCSKGRISRFALLAAAMVFGVSAAFGQQRPPDVPIPPPPSETFVRLTEAELIRKLPEREQALIVNVRDSRDRFDKLLDISDLRLAAIGFEIDRNAGPVRELLLLYDATLRLTDKRLRSAETNAGPRDKLYKRLERRLSKQKLIFDAILSELRPDDAPTGQSVANTLESIRVRALNSALDADILETPKEP